MWGLSGSIGVKPDVPSLSMVMVSGIVFGRPHLSFRSMNARISFFLRIRKKRIKDLNICVWFLADLPVSE